MARKVKFENLQKPSFWALSVGAPFCKELVAKLTKGLRRYALTKDGNWYRLWAE
ncbi:MAG: hypothetical protein PHC97_00065 [Patescibacteria group bacterium]|nr:hypothetical protein [Patescibacteria group bacterium]